MWKDLLELETIADGQFERIGLGHCLLLLVATSLYPAQETHGMQPLAAYEFHSQRLLEHRIT